MTVGRRAGETRIAPAQRRLSLRLSGQAVGRNPLSALIPCHRIVDATPEVWLASRFFLTLRNSQPSVQAGRSDNTAHISSGHSVYSR